MLKIPNGSHTFLPSVDAYTYCMYCMLTQCTGGKWLTLFSDKKTSGMLLFLFTGLFLFQMLLCFNYGIFQTELTPLWMTLSVTPAVSCVPSESANVQVLKPLSPQRHCLCVWCQPLGQVRTWYFTGDLSVW